MGTLTGKQAGKIIEIFENTPSKKVQAILESGLLADLRDMNIAKVDRDEFRKLGGLKSLGPDRIVYPLSVNYDRSVENGVKAGRYDWVNSDITSEHFPAERKGTVDIEVELIHYIAQVGLYRILADKQLGSYLTVAEPGGY